MMCRHPYVKDRTGEAFASTNPRDWLRGVPFRCGKCLSCRVSIRREWTTRLILEMLKSDLGCFVTLTYSENYVPVTESGFRTLSKRDLQLFMKRFRRNLERYKKRSYPVRFFACGEYGKHGTQRPHYHIILFGCSDMDIDVIRSIQEAWSEPALPGQHKQDKPMFGSVQIEPLTSKTIAYTAGYVMKKLISPVRKHKVVPKSLDVGSKRYTFDKLLPDRDKSCRDENGVLAEFRLMSRMPGLGTGFVFDLVALWRSSESFRRALVSAGDVPSVIRAFGRTLFLDRLIKTKLREALNIEPDPTLYYSQVRDGYFEWLSSGLVSPGKDYYDYLVSQDDQKFKQLQDRIKRQLQKREKI